MKKLLKFSFILFSVVAMAQQEVNTSFATQMATMFSPLEKNRTPHGLLLDIAMEFTNVPAFNGIVSDSTFVTPKTLKQIYNTLLMSRIRDVSTGFVTPEMFENNWSSQRAEEHIALSGLYFKYSRFATTAATAGKLTYANGKIYDRYIRGVWQNPYQEMQTFAMTTPIDVYTGLNLKVKIPQAIFYSNYAAEIQRIDIDFADGLGYRQVAYNQLVNVNYTTEGLQTWKYRLTLTNGQTLFSHSKIKIKKGLRITNLTGSGSPAYRTASTITWNNCSPATTDLYSLDIQSTGTFNGLPGKARVFIDDAGNDCKITNPLIVVEGYDLTSILSPETRFSSEDFKNFIESVKKGENLSTLINGNPLTNIPKQYDIIYVNWNNGMDFIERNALVVEEVIKWVNAQKALAGSTTKNVVMGQSMGGIVCRYAIRDMEQRGLTHQVKLFVSQDSPQQGASVPLSIQALYRNAMNQVIQAPAYQLFAAASSFSQQLSQIGVPINPINNPLPIYKSLLDRPATAQMLINRFNSSYGLDNSTHTNFYANLNAKGFPQQAGIRNIAISNGNECGTTQNFNAGDVLISYSGTKKLSFLQNALAPFAAAFGGMLIDPDLFAVTALSLFPGGSRFDAFLEDRALYQNGGNKIHDLNVSYTKWILGIWKQKAYIINKQVYQPTSINKHFDNYGGGFIDIAGYTGTLNMSGLYMRDKFLLVPTPSALAINATTDAHYKTPYIGALPPSAPINSPFASFTTAFKSATNPNKNNEKHLEFNARNGNWLAAELNALPENTNCSFLCNAQPITGQNVICNNTSNTFTAPTGGSFYSWQIISGNNLVTLSNANSQSATINTLNGVSGEVTIRVNISGISTTANAIPQSCGFLDKTIWVGKPSGSNVSIGLGYGSSPVEVSILQDLSYQGITNISWVNDSSYPNGCGSIQEGSDYNAYNTYMTAQNECTVWMNLTLTNPCGSTNIWTNVFSNFDPNISYRTANTNIFKIYPNPSKDIVNIDLRNQDSQPKTDSPISGELFDLMGLSISKVETKDNKATFSVEGLRKGIYVLKIYIDDQTETHQIAVE